MLAGSPSGSRKLDPDGTTVLVKQSEGLAPVSQRTDKSVYVAAYGRMIAIEATGSLMALQRQLEGQLGATGQSLSFRDTNGQSLTSDQELMQAITLGHTPIQASFTDLTYSDTAIQSMELKKDEIAQMQWVLVREQFVALHSQIGAMATQVQSLKTDLEQQQLNLLGQQEEFRNETFNMIAKESQARLEGQSMVSTRVEFLSQLIHNEQSQRELLANTLQKQMESAWDVLETEKNARCADTSSIRADLDGLKQALKNEEILRGQDMDKTLNNISDVQNAVEDVAKLLREEVQERNLKLAQVGNDIAESGQVFQKQLNSFQLNIDALNVDTKKRLDNLEERFNHHYDHFAKTLEQKGTAIQKCAERNEALPKMVDQERFERQALQGSIASNAEKVEYLVDYVSRIEKDCRAEVEREKTLREEQSRSVSAAIRLYAQEIQAIDKMLTDTIAKEKSQEAPQGVSGTLRASNTLYKAQSGPQTLPQRVNELLADVDGQGYSVKTTSTVQQVQATKQFNAQFQISRAPGIYTGNMLISSRTSSPMMTTRAVQGYPMVNIAGQRGGIQATHAPTASARVRSLTPQGTHVVRQGSGPTSKPGNVASVPVMTTVNSTPRAPTRVV